MNSKKLFTAIMTIALAFLGSVGVTYAVTGTFTEWDAIASGQPVRDFNPHITDLDRTGNTGFRPNTPWYTIDNRTPGPPCALGHLDSSTDELISWGLGGGVPIGIDVDDESGRVWWTVSGIISGVSGAHVAFKFPGATVDTFRHFPGTGNAAGIITDATGTAYFAELPSQIVRVTPMGGLKRWTSVGSQPRYLGFDSSGNNLYFTTSCSRTINRLNLVTNVLTSWSFPTVASCTTSILDAFGLFVENDTSIWYADTRGNKVARLNPSTNVITEFTKAGMNNPTFVVIEGSQAFITERLGNTVDIMDIGGGTDTIVTPSTNTLSPTETTVTPVDFDRTRISRVVPPVETTVTGIDPPAIIRFPLPMSGSEPIGMTEVVEAPIGSTNTFGIFGDEFSFSNSKIFFFKSELIEPNPILTPATATNPLGITHTVTATLVDENGMLFPDVTITFEVIAGPNAGDTDMDTTDANGEAFFTYTGDGGGGVDQIRASFVTSAGSTKLSNTVTKVWDPTLNSPPVALCQDVTVPTAAGTCGADASVDDGSFDPDGGSVTLDQEPPGPYSLGMTTVTLKVTDTVGAMDSCMAKVTVGDITPPTVSCVESMNPSSKNVPKASKTNEDGFYLVSAGDNCSSEAEPNIMIGTYQLTEGETIKITQTPGKSGVALVNTMGRLNIKHFQVGPEDAVITATDGSGNQASVTCFVPPPPK